MDKKDCKIVQDLLPNYIDNLTSEDTKIFIDNHIKTCEECTRMLENMKKDLNIQNDKKEKKIINFIKKYNKRMKILKGILIIILFIFCARTIRNGIIIKSITSKSQNNNYNNYQVKCWNYDRDKLSTVEAYYIEDGSYYIKRTNYEIQDGAQNSAERIIFEYSDGKTTNYYTITSDGKSIANLGINYAYQTPIIDLKNYYITSDNFVSFLKNCIFSSIRTEKCNGEECYFITNYYSANSNIYRNGIYVSKENGLIMRRLGSPTTKFGQTVDGITDYYYGFNNVVEAFLMEPDISEYEIVEGENKIKNFDE